MSELISDGESASEVKEAPPDVSGMFKFAGMLVMGVLALAGIYSVGDLLWGKTKATKKTDEEDTDDEETQADYEKDYLDETISDEALNEHTVGLTA